VITVFGSINLDLIFALPAIPRSGETLLTRTVTIAPGGKGANQAVAAALDGARVVLAGAVGRDALAAGALGLLRQAGVDLSRVIETDAATGCAAIAVDPQGNNAIAVGSGANLLALETQVEPALLGPGNTLVLQMEVDREETEALIRRARAAGTRIILNLAPAGPLSTESLSAVDLLVVNEAEANWLADYLGCSAEAAGLRATLGVDVVRTLGEAGSELATATGLHSIAAHPITPVDTTAAGDCFVGVLAAALDRGLAISDALHRASMAAAICCTRSDSQNSLPASAEIDAALSA
jgi:ribokinase